MRDELLITVGTPDAPGSRATADAAAAAAEGVVSGGLDDLGVYEVRWATSQDIAARRAQLLAQPGVTAVSESNIGLIGENRVPPGDWSDGEGDGPQATWPFTQVRAQAAWDTTQGSDVTVGVVDGGVALPNHEDLNVKKKLGQDQAIHHATHVAGLACAKANGIGLVGMAWGCPIVTQGWGDKTDKSILRAASEVAKQPGVKVVNMSLGYRNEKLPKTSCYTASQQAEIIGPARGDIKRQFRDLFVGKIGRDIIWTISAGNNCAPGVASPWGQNADLDNVLTVAATNSESKLARFSGFGAGVEVAAPGGVSVEPGLGGGTVGIWSTSLKSCGLFGLSRCGTYATDWGTSMSAPIVAGIAALVRSAHSGYGADQAARCITLNAGANGVGTVPARSELPRSDLPAGAAGANPSVDYPPNTLPIVNAEAAVACLDPLDKSNYLGRQTNGNWILDFAEETSGVLGAVNQAPTTYPTCTEPPGTKIFSGFVAQASGQWNGSVLGSNCTTRAWNTNAAMRAIRAASGATAIVMAWASDANGSRPNIDANGTITSASPYNQTRVSRAPQQAARDVAPSSPAPSAEPSLRGTPTAPPRPGSAQPLPAPTGGGS